MLLPPLCIINSNISYKYWTNRAELIAIFSRMAFDAKVPFSFIVFSPFRFEPTSDRCWANVPTQTHFYCMLPPSCYKQSTETRNWKYIISFSWWLWVVFFFCKIEMSLRFQPFVWSLNSTTFGWGGGCGNLCARKCNNQIVRNHIFYFLLVMVRLNPFVSDIRLAPPRW